MRHEKANLMKITQKCQRDLTPGWEALLVVLSHKKEPCHLKRINNNFLNKVQAQGTQGTLQVCRMQNRSQDRLLNFCKCFTPFPPYFLKLSRLRHPVILGQTLITSVGLQYGVRVVFVYSVWFFNYNDGICVSFENQMSEIWLHIMVWSHIKAERWW